MMKNVQLSRLFPQGLTAFLFPRLFLPVFVRRDKKKRGVMKEGATY